MPCAAVRATDRGSYARPGWPRCSTRRTAIFRGYRRQLCQSDVVACRRVEQFQHAKRADQHYQDQTDPWEPAAEPRHIDLQHAPECAVSGPKTGTGSDPKSEIVIISNDDAQHVMLPKVGAVASCTYAAKTWELLAITNGAGPKAGSSATPYEPRQFDLLRVRAQGWDGPLAAPPPL
jgi:hypothetical protein